MSSYIGHFVSPQTRARRGTTKPIDLACSAIMRGHWETRKGVAFNDPRVAAETAARVRAAHKFVVGQQVRVPTRWGVVWARIECILPKGSIDVYVPSTGKVLNFAAGVIEALNHGSQEVAPA